jgi:hypothetical protein
MGKIIELNKQAKLLKMLKNIIKDYSAKGGIIIIQTDDGNKIAQYGLSPKQIRENLCLAIFYSEKIILDEQYNELPNTL